MKNIKLISVILMAIFVSEIAVGQYADSSGLICRHENTDTGDSLNYYYRLFNAPNICPEYVHVVSENSVAITLKHDAFSTEVGGPPNPVPRTETEFGHNCRTIKVRIGGN